MGQPYLTNDSNQGHVYDWREELKEAIRMLLNTDEIKACISTDHISKTPERYLAALDEYFSGCLVDPKAMLTKALFKNPDKNPQMIHVGNESFYSTCAHHLAPIFGVMHFAYIPRIDGDIIGLSKIPRLIEIYARRPQVQEQLTNDIVNAFQEIVQPAGCALLVRARHFCMEARGIKAHGTETTTTALRGVFTKQDIKEEFLSSANRLELRQ